MKWGCRGHWGRWGCWGCWGHWGCRDFKAWKITTEDFRVILLLEFNNQRTKIILTESWKFLLNFSTFSIGGCWGQSMLLFWKLVDKTQISKPQDHTDNFKHNPISIFLSVRPKLLLTFQYEIPCIIDFEIDIVPISKSINDSNGPDWIRTKVGLTPDLGLD